MKAEIMFAVCGLIRHLTFGKPLFARCFSSVSDKHYIIYPLNFLLNNIP